MITKQLRSISSHKAASPDNIPSWVLKDFADILALPVSMLINESSKKEQLALIWKCANITPLLKSSTVNDINTDLRPISLTPTILKIAEEYVVALFRRGFENSSEFLSVFRSFARNR